MATAVAHRAQTPSLLTAYVRKTSPLDIAVMWIKVPDLCIDTDSA